MKPERIELCSRTIERGKWRGKATVEIAERGREMIEQSKVLLSELARVHTVLRDDE